RSVRLSGRWRERESWLVLSLLLGQFLIEEMTLDVSAAHARVVRVRSPFHIAERFVELDRDGLRLADVEVEDAEVLAPGPLLDCLHQHPGEAVAACPGGDEAVLKRRGETLRLVVARWLHELGRAAGHAVEARSEE